MKMEEKLLKSNSILRLTFLESQPQNPEFSNNPENFHPCANLV